jgi:membrane protein required for colicin V production
MVYMNWVDWSIIVVILVSGLISMKRGFIKEVLSLVVWVAAFLVASWLKEPLADLFAGWLDTVSMRQLSAFILVFITVLVLGGVVNYLLETLIAMIGLKTTDHLFGVLFGLARGILVVMIAVVYLPKVLPVHQDTWWHDSVLIPHFAVMEDKFFALVLTAYDAIKRLL